jgi:c-di-GMP phosphodiesterase
VLEQMNLPPLVVEALLHNNGKYAPYLGLAIACEAFDQDQIVNLSCKVGLSLTQVTICQTEALIWAEMANQ